MNKKYKYMEFKIIYFITLLLFINSILSCTITNCDSSNLNCQIKCGDKKYRFDVMLVGSSNGMIANSTDFYQRK